MDQNYNYKQSKKKRIKQKTSEKLIKIGDMNNYNGEYCYREQAKYLNFIIVIQTISNQIRKIQIKMYIFEIRFAETGHSQTYDKITSIQMLQQKIFKQFKIQICNQRLFSKKGSIINSTDRLDQYSQNSLKKTYSNDNINPMIMKEAFGMYLFNHKEMLKNYSEDRPEKQNSQKQSREILKKRQEYCQGLRQNIYQLQPLTKKFSNEQIIQIVAYKPQLKDIANYWLTSTLAVRDHMCTYKQVQEILDRHVNLWENQRKALMILIKNLESIYLDKNKCINNSKQSISNIEKMFRQLYSSEQSLQASIKYQMGKSSKNSQNKYLLEQNIEELRKKCNSVEVENNKCNAKLLQFKRNIKQKYKSLQKPLKELDALKRKKLREIQSCFGEMKQNYITLIEAITCKVEKKSDDSKICLILNQRKSIQAKYEVYKKKTQEYTIQMEENFVHLYNSYIQNQQMVKTEYKKYYSIYLDFEEHIKQNCQRVKQQTLLIYKTINDIKESLSQGSLSQSVQSFHSIVSPQQKMIKRSPQKASSSPYITNQSKIKQIEQKEIKRRLHFNNKLQSIQQQIKQILRQEQSARKTYLSEILSIEQLYGNQILGNVRVPCVLVNFDESSDIDMMNKYKMLNYQSSMHSSIGISSNNINPFNKQNTKQNNQLLSNLAVNFDLYKQSGMDRILKELQFLKCLNYNIKYQNPQNESKIKNIQLLLQKSSDIFHHIYNHKLNMINKVTQSQLQAYTNRINILEEEKKYLHEQGFMYSLQRQSNKQLENNFEMLKKQLIQLRAEKLQVQKQFNQIYEDNMKTMKNYQLTIQENKKQISKLKEQKRQFEQKISLDVGNTMQTLLSQLQKSQITIRQLSQMNHEYKVVMGDQAIRIQTLQTQLKIYKKQNSQLSKDMNKQQEIKQISRLKQCFYGQNLNIKGIQEIPQNRQMITQQLKQQHNASQMPLLKKQSKSITNEEIRQIQKQISKLEKKIEQLKQQNEELKNENNHLNDQIFKIAMKDTDDIEIQTDAEDYAGLFAQHKQSIMVMAPTINHLDFIKVDSHPQVGELRVFIPFSPGIYVALKSSKIAAQNAVPPSSINFLTSQTRNYLQLHQTQLHASEHEQIQQSQYPYIIDMNCLTAKARQLLMQCSLVVVLRVTKILPAADRFYVEGTVRSALGFEDEEIMVKDYGNYLS